jgi:N-acetylmuramoyl-L-alanine amidase
MEIIPRTAWGAKPAVCSAPLTQGLKGLAVHYSASDADEQSDHANCAGRVKGIQRYHMDTHGWCDIAYNHLLCKHGVVFAGRGFGLRSAANGTNPGNSHYFAACFLGNDTANRRDFTEEARDALIELRKEYLKRYPNAYETVGHRDITSTSCPGDEIYAFVKSASFKAAVKGGTLPGPSPKPRWFWAWGDWYLGGRVTPRPDAPARIPPWAWAALEEWQKQH